MVSFAAASSIEEPSRHDALLTPPSSPRSVRLGEGGTSASLSSSDHRSPATDQDLSAVTQSSPPPGKGMIRKSEIARHARLRPVAPPLTHKPHPPPCLPTLLLRQLRASEGNDALDPPTSSNSPCSPSSCSATVAEVHAVHAIERLSLDDLPNAPVPLQMPRCTMRDSPDFKPQPPTSSLPHGAVQQPQQLHKSASAPQFRQPSPSPPYPPQKPLIVPRPASPPSTMAMMQQLPAAAENKEKEGRGGEAAAAEEADSPSCRRLSESSLHYGMGESMQSNIVHTNNSITHIFKAAPEHNPNASALATITAITSDETTTMHDICPTLPSQEESMPTSPVLNRALCSTSSLLRQRRGRGTGIAASAPRQVCQSAPSQLLVPPVHVVQVPETIIMMTAAAAAAIQEDGHDEVSAVPSLHSGSAVLASKVAGEAAHPASCSTSSLKEPPPPHSPIVLNEEGEGGSDGCREGSVAGAAAAAVDSNTPSRCDSHNLLTVARCTQLSSHQLHDAHTTPLLLPLYHSTEGVAPRERASVSLAKSSLPSVSSQHAGSVAQEGRSQMSQLQQSRTGPIFLPSSFAPVPDTPNNTNTRVNCREMSTDAVMPQGNIETERGEAMEHYHGGYAREEWPSHQLTAIHPPSSVPPLCGLAEASIRNNPLERAPSLHIFDERSVNSFGSLCHMTDSVPAQERRLTLDKSLAESPLTASPRRDTRRAACMRATISAVHGFFCLYIIVSTVLVYFFTDRYCDWFNALNYDHRMHVFSDRKSFYFLFALLCTPLFLLSHWGVYLYRSNPRRQRQLHLRRLAQIQHDLNAPIRSPRHHYGGSHSTHCNFSHKGLRERRERCRQRQQQEQQSQQPASQIGETSSSTSVRLNEVVFPSVGPHSAQGRLGRLGRWLATPLRRLMLRRPAVVQPPAKTGVPCAQCGAVCTCGGMEHGNAPLHTTTATTFSSSTHVTSAMTTPSPHAAAERVTDSAALPAVEMQAMTADCATAHAAAAVPTFAQSMDDSAYYCGGRRPEPSILCATTRVSTSSHRPRGSLLMSSTRASVLAAERAACRRASLPTTSSSSAYCAAAASNSNNNNNTTTGGEGHTNGVAAATTTNNASISNHHHQYQPPAAGAQERHRDTPPPSPSRLTSSRLALRSPLASSPPLLPRTPPPPLHSSMTERDHCGGGGYHHTTNDSTTAGVAAGARDGSSSPSHETVYEDDQEQLLLDEDAELSVPCWPSLCCCFELDRFSVMIALCAISRLLYFVVSFTALVLLLVLAFNRLVSFALMDPSYSMWYNALVKDDCGFVENMELHASCSGWSSLCNETFVNLFEAHDNGCAYCPPRESLVQALKVTCERRFEILRWRNLCTYIVLVCVDSLLLIFTIITSSVSICMNYWA